MVSPPDVSLIKGYLPVRLNLPSEKDRTDETFFYVKEHFASSNDSKNKSNTLFLANVPVVPLVDTKLFLTSIFGRYGDLTRVTVIQDPRKLKNENSRDSILHSWTSKFARPSFLPTMYSNGKFAHVVFASNKEMHKSLQAIREIMATKGRITIDKIELQTLADESARKHGQGGDEESDHETEESGILAVAARYRAKCSQLDRIKLMEECNNIMQEYEEAEEEQVRRAKASAANEADEDGFVTVSHSAQVGSKIELEASGEQQQRRKAKRKRSKKESIGASELSDFYRFQTKEKRRNTLQDLRLRFEQDLAKVKKLKEDKHYRPF